MSGAVLEVEGLSFSFGDKRVLSDISFTVANGEWFSIIGPNGAGKSTLLRLIDRVITGASGMIKVAGRPLGAYRQSELAKVLGYVPQAGDMLFPYTAHEFVMMGRYPHLSPFTSISEEDERAADDAMAITGTTRFASRSMKSLSGGERQKVFIAAALAQGAKALLLDEPTTFLDPKSESEILRTLSSANRERGVTIVSVTHDINSAALHSDRILAIAGGRAAFLGKPEELMRAETLRSVYEKDFTLISHPAVGKTIIAPDAFV